MDQDKFQYLPHASSKKLLIFFSGVGARGFTGYKMTEDLGVNRLFIRDPGNTWFCGNIPGLCLGVSDLLNRIRRYMGEFSLDDVYVAGSSMGAYAAILYGSLLGARKILSFAPAIVMHHFLQTELRDHSVVENKDLRALISQSHAANYNIYYGTCSFADLWQASLCSHFPNVKTFGIDRSPHDVMKFLKARGVLKQVLLNFITDTATDLSNMVQDIFSCPHTVDMINRAGYAFLLEKDYAMAKELIDKLRLKLPQVPVLQLVAGECYSKLGHAEQALDSFQEVMKKVGTSYPTHRIGFACALELLRLKRYDEAASFMDEAISLEQVQNPLYLQIRGNIEILRKRHRNALHWLQLAFELDPHLPGLARQIAIGMNDLEAGPSLTTSTE